MPELVGGSDVAEVTSSQRYLLRHSWSVAERNKTWHPSFRDHGAVEQESKRQKGVDETNAWQYFLYRNADCIHDRCVNFVLYENSLLRQQGPCPSREQSSVQWEGNRKCQR